MTDNPSLKALLSVAIEQAYGTAVIEAETETGLSGEAFPAVCPWTYVQMLDSAFWPGGE
jgi:hypothetical protein